MVGVRHAFEQADDAGMPWDGGYVFTTYEHYELPDLFSWVAGGDYEEAVREEIRDCLVEKTYASRWWAERDGARRGVLHRLDRIPRPDPAPDTLYVWSPKTVSDRISGASFPGRNSPARACVGLPRHSGG